MSNFKREARVHIAFPSKRCLTTGCCLHPHPGRQELMWADELGTRKGCNNAAASPPLPGLAGDVHLSIHGLAHQEIKGGFGCEALLRGLQGQESVPCQQAHPKSRVPGKHLCRKEREPLAFSSLLSTTSPTAALWHNTP